MTNSLTINLRDSNENIIACVYYYGSNHTKTALGELQNLKNMIPDNTAGLTEYGLREMLINKYLNQHVHIFDFLGLKDDELIVRGGVAREDLERAKKMFPNIPFDSYIESMHPGIGYVGFDDESITRCNLEADGKIDLDIETGIIHTNVAYRFHENECDLALRIHETDLEDVPGCPVNIECFPISELETLMDFVEKYDFYRYGDGLYTNTF